MPPNLTPNPTPTPERRRGLACLVAACLTTLLTTGCDGDVQDSKPRSSPMPSPTSGTTKDLRTCEDGDCTVEVREGDVIPFGESVRAPDLTIDAIGPAGVDLRLSGEGTTSTFSGQSPYQGVASPRTTGPTSGSWRSRATRPCSASSRTVSEC